MSFIILLITYILFVTVSNNYVGWSCKREQRRFRDRVQQRIEDRQRQSEIEAAMREVDEYLAADESPKDSSKTSVL